MATKTITLELDAYEKLKRAKRGNESFSDVVRRLRFDNEASTGSRILEELECLYHAERPVPPETFNYWDAVEKEERDQPRVSSSHWD